MPASFAVEQSEPLPIEEKTIVAESKPSISPLPKPNTTTSTPGMFSIPSLSDLSKIISAETQEEKEDIVISYDQIIKAWSSFTDVKKAQGNTDYYLALSGARLEFNNPILTVRFAIESTKELFEKFSDDFLVQMRKKMNSNELIFEVKMEEKNNENLKLYTDKDKFQYIAEKNPKILELQKRFGLDFEY